MWHDTELLKRYADDGSEPAFTELVERHLSLVYSAALRETGGDTATAQDLTQAVFTELARKAARLARHPVLAGWLYTTVRRTAANWRRSTQRRQQREFAAQAMNDLLSPDPAEALWQQVRPALDDAMHELREADRSAVVLRFFEDRSLKEVGEALGLSENAARMRVDRSLEKLRQLLARRGISSTASGLAAALSAGAVVTAPAGLASGIATAAVAAAAASSASTTLVALKIMSLTKTQAAIAGVFALTAVSIPTWQQVRINQLGAENIALQAQSAEATRLRAEVVQLEGAAADRAELDRLRVAEADLKTEVARLRAAVTEARRNQDRTTPTQASASPAESGGETNALSAGMKDLMKGAMEQQFYGQLHRMKAKLNLTPEQEEAIRAIYTKQVEQAGAVAEKMFSGRLSRDEMSTLRSSSGNPEEEIKALLSPEQADLYKEHKQEEAVSNARLVANAELLQMQGSLGLTQEQQDQVFNALYDHTLNQLTGKGTAALPTSSPGDAGAVFEAAVEQKVKALEGILTPDQLEDYRQVQLKQASLIKSMLPRGE